MINDIVDFLKDIKCDYDILKADPKSVVIKNLDIRLDKQKYGWILSKIVIFPKGFLKTKSLKVVYSAIRIIHPVHDWFWVLMSMEDPTQFFIYDGSFKKYKSLNEINDIIKETKNYVGRHLTAEDFA